MRQNIIPYANPEGWRNAFALAQGNAERLSLLCSLLIEEREWHEQQWRKEGFAPPHWNTPPIWF